MSSIQFINDASGRPLYVVLPLVEYEQLIASKRAAEPKRKDIQGNNIIPNEIIYIMVEQDVSLLAAWRIYSGLSQLEVASRLGTTQSAVSQWESVDSRPQRRTRTRLARLFGCYIEQMSL